MKFGKLQDISQVDFRLPDDHIDGFHKEGSQHQILEVFIGATGWGMPSWRSKWYPEKAKTSSFFNHYTQQFNAVEFNSSYYAIPKEEALKNYHTQSPKDFKFYPKIPQAISRSKLPYDQLHMLHDCHKRFESLEVNLGAFFMQLSDYQGIEYLDNLYRFLDELPEEMSLHIEFRSKELFLDKRVFSHIVSTFKNREIGLVITDVSGRRDVLHMAPTTEEVLVRFVGNDLDKSDYSRIDDWVDRLEKWRLKGVKKVAFFTHEPDNHNAPDIAKYLAGKLKLNKGIRTRGPKEISNGQMELFL